MLEVAKIKSADRERIVRRLFRIALFAKLVHSVIELGTAIALYFTSGETLLSLTRTLTSHEMLEDPNDIVANYLLRSAASLSVDAKTTAAFYLASHGAIKLCLVIMVLRDYRWAYPLFMAALVVLIAYQTYQLTLGFSPWLAALTVFDLLILWLTWHEFRIHRRAQISN